MIGDAMENDTSHCTEGCNCHSNGGDSNGCPRMTGNRLIWKAGDDVAAALAAQDQDTN